MGTHPIFESDFDCLTVCLELAKPKKHQQMQIPNIKSEIT